MNNRVDHNTLTAALATPDDGIDKPTRVHPTSAITQIAALKLGETWSRVEPLNLDTTLAQFAQTSADLRDALRNTVNSSMRHAKNKTGATYTIETGDFISSGRSIYLVAVVTRIG